ncbi:hypothetical protein AB0M39_40950 [Streptomyces sp. NPDC051907]|uniref:hypothetical protein n=1 Tax=Streptomyces sp. NPDC051907 TaxID=3155284 RepID=UPI003444A956
MGVQITRGPSPQSHPPPPLLGAEGKRMVTVCALRAQTLRRSADQASPLQAERAVLEYGAAVALDRAASLWADCADGQARSWMAAAENALAAALVPIPWTRRT